MTDKKIAILITHGTDTLAWTHAFVRYAIKNNRINVAITGSQIPFPEKPNFSDAYLNVANSVHFLTKITPPNVFTVFNYGTEAFSDSLYKIDRWNNNAFTGDMIARMEWDEVKFFDNKAIRTEDAPVKLDKLYLLTTGGTIAAESNIDGTLAPVETDKQKKTYRLKNFIQDSLSDSFAELEEQSIMNIDSSDMTFEKMKTVVNKIVEIVHKYGYTETFADLAFDKSVKIVYTDPFKAISDYEKEMEGASAVIIAGYGGGNINIERKSGYSPLDLLIKRFENNIPVVLSSQVAKGPADFVYGNAHYAIESGAISGVDLSLPEIQIRLSYLLGHKTQIEEHAKRMNIPYMKLLDRLFISGMKFRTRKSKETYAYLKGFKPFEIDVLVNRTFEESLSVFTNS